MGGEALQVAGLRERGKLERRSATDGRLTSVIKGFVSVVSLVVSVSHFVRGVNPSGTALR